MLQVGATYCLTAVTPIIVSYRSPISSKCLVITPLLGGGHMLQRYICILF